MNRSPIRKSTPYPSRVGSPVTPALIDQPKDAALNLLCLAAQTNHFHNHSNMSYQPYTSCSQQQSSSSTTPILQPQPQQHDTNSTQIPTINIGQQQSTQSTSPVSIQPFNTSLSQSIHHTTQHPFPLYMTQPSTHAYSSTPSNTSHPSFQYLTYPSIPNTCQPTMGLGMNIPIATPMIYDPYNHHSNPINTTSQDTKQGVPIMGIGMNMGIGIGMNMGINLTDGTRCSNNIQQQQHHHHHHHHQQQQQHQQQQHHHQSNQLNGIRKVKGPWRPEEDKILTELVSKFGPRRWTVIASHIVGRTGKQARERWLNQLSPDLAKRAWTEEEDGIVMQAHARLGNRWSEIAKLLKGRTDNATKNRFNTTIRRQISELSSVARAQLSNSTIKSVDNNEKANISPATSGDELDHIKEEEMNKKKRKFSSTSLTENEKVKRKLENHQGDGPK